MCKTNLCENLQIVEREIIAPVVSSSTVAISHASICLDAWVQGELWSILRGTSACRLLGRDAAAFCTSPVSLNLLQFDRLAESTPKLGTTLICFKPRTSHCQTIPTSHNHYKRSSFEAHLKFYQPWQLNLPFDLWPKNCNFCADRCIPIVQTIMWDWPITELVVGMSQAICNA